MQLHPLAYVRESERLNKMARLASADQDERQARRLAKMALEMKRKACAH